MNVLFLLGVYPSYGGVERVTTVLANAFIKKGYRVDIVSFEQPHPDLARKELDARAGLYKFDKPICTFENIRRLHELIVGHKVDVVINQWCVPFYVSLLCCLAIRGTSSRLVSVHHNVPDTNARIKKIESRLEKHIGNNFVNALKLSAVRFFSRLSLRYTYIVSNRYIVLAPSFIPLAKRYMFLSNDNKIRSVGNPITVDVTHDINEKQKEILYVGRIEYNQKRTFRLMDIWKSLSEKFPDWKLTIVGDGEDRGDLERKISEYKLKNVTIEGFQSPSRYYERASLMLLVSEFEGFPLVIGEAMAYGVVPIVLDSFAALKDIIVDGKSGIAVPYPYDETIFIEKTEELMQNGLLRRKMEKEARIRAKDFSLQAIIDKWKQLFKEVCYESE